MSAHVKRCVYLFIKEHNLDFDRLLDASEYKEKYRMDMIRWGEERRTEDPSFFCRLATQGEGSDRPVWIVSDARRLSDLQYFHSNFRKQVITVRVTADEDVRKARGYVFTKGKYIISLLPPLSPNLSTTINNTNADIVQIATTRIFAT